MTGCAVARVSDDRADSAEQGGDKAAWIAAMLPALKGSFPSVKALVGFT